MFRTARPVCSDAARRPWRGRPGLVSRHELALFHTAAHPCRRRPPFFNPQAQSPRPEIGFVSQNSSAGLRRIGPEHGPFGSIIEGCRWIVCNSLFNRYSVTIVAYVSYTACLSVSREIRTMQGLCWRLMGPDRLLRNRDLQRIIRDGFGSSFVTRRTPPCGPEA